MTYGSKGITYAQQKAQTKFEAWLSEKNAAKRAEMPYSPISRLFSKAGWLSWEAVPQQ